VTHARLVGRLRQLGRYLPYLAGVLFLLMFVDGWRSFLLVVFGGWFAYWLITMVIDHRFRQLLRPIEPSMPFVPRARVWSFQCSWSQAFARRMVTSRGFQPRRDWNASDLFLKSLKIEESTYFFRVHVWTVPLSDQEQPAAYSWNDHHKSTPRPFFALWQLRLDSHDAPGWCSFLLSLRRPAPNGDDQAWYLVFSVLWENESTKSRNDVIFELPLDPDRFESTGHAPQYPAEFDWEWFLECPLSRGNPA